MAKFYFAASILLLGGLALFRYGNKTPKEADVTATFAGICIALTGAATLTLAFGYHVKRFTERDSP